MDFNYSIFYFDYDYFTYSNYSEIGFEDLAETHLSSTLFFAVCQILIFCISAPGNSFILLVLLRERSWKTTPDILHLQLTVSALCFTVTLPFRAYNVLHDWVFGSWACGVIGGASCLGQNSCVLIITAMTVYHCVAVDHASCLSDQASKRFLLMASIMIWLICAAVSIRFSVDFVVESIGFGQRSCPDFSYILFTFLFYTCIQSVLIFLIPFVIIAFCYVYTATKHCRTNEQHQAPRLILGITVGLFICLAPYNIGLFIHSLILGGVLDHSALLIPDYVVYIFIILPILHCCLNLFHICGAQRFKRYLCMPCDTSSQGRDRSQAIKSMAVMSLNDTSV